MSQLTIEQIFQSAVRHHRAGELSQAENLYRQILARQPGHADSLQNLGLIAQQVGRDDIAIDLIRQAIAIKPNVPESYSNLGSALRNIGKLEDAIAACRRAIALKPDFPAAHYNLATALKDNEAVDEAIAAYRRAIALKPNFHEAHCNLGAALKHQGQLDEAIAAYRLAIALNPKFHEAHCNLGNALRDKGELDESITSSRQAIALKPSLSEAHYNLGNALRDKGQLEEALCAIRQAIRLKPNYPEAHNNLGEALLAKGQLDEAIAAHHQAIALKPDFHEAHCNLGNALREAGQLDEAIAACRRAIELKPNMAEAHNNLAIALRDKGELDDAMVAYRQAIAFKEQYPEAHNNLGNVLSAKGQLDEAVAAYRQAIALNPSFPDFHYNLAHTLLLQGDFLQGWPEYEWRWKRQDFACFRRDYTQPLWDGSDIANRTILLYGEQGFGDTIQFARYVSLVAERGARVVVVCQPELQRLLQGASAPAQWITPADPLPPFDVHCPLLSLPLAFGTSLQTIPNSVPYLQADSQDIERWRERIGDDGAGLKVGLAWAGRASHKNDRNRSLPLSILAPLARVPSVNFYNLQKGEAAKQAKNPPEGMKLVDWAQDLKDFSETAALIANLDLVITVDTAVAHLAGAMGKPVWLLLPFVPDWRWMMDREDSPWYPTMRLLRQKAIGQWAEVIERVAAGPSGIGSYPLARYSGRRERIGRLPATGLG